jgi:hypothetical protein
MLNIGLNGIAMTDAGSVLQWQGKVLQWQGSVLQWQGASDIAMARKGI